MRLFRSSEDGPSGGVAWIVFTALAVVFSIPLPVYLTAGIPYGVDVPRDRAVMTLLHGDHLQLFYHVQLLTRAVTGDVPWFTNPFEFATPWSDLGPYFYFLPLSLVFLAFSWLGDVVAYNGLFLTTTAFVGFTGFLLGRRLTGSGWAGLVAGTFVALLPYRVATAVTGHPAGYYAPFLLLGGLAVIPAWIDRSRSWAIAAGVSIFFVALYEPHYAYALAGAGPVIFLAALGSRANAPEEARTGDAGVLVVLGFVLTSVLAGGALGEYLHRNIRPLDPVARTGLAAVIGAGITGLNVLFLRALATLTGASFRRLFRQDLLWQLVWLLPFVDVLFPNLLPGKLLGALGVGLWGIGKIVVAASVPTVQGVREALRGRVGVLFWLVLPTAVGGAFLLWGFRETIDASIVAGRGWNDVRLFAPDLTALTSRTPSSVTGALYLGLVPWILIVLGSVAGSRHRGMALVFTALFLAGLVLSVGPALDPWLPVYRAAHTLVPFFDFIRVSSKFFAVVVITGTALVAYGTAWLVRRTGTGSAPAVTALLIVLIGVDFSAYLPLGICLLPSENEAYTRLRSETDPEDRFLAVPLWPGDSADSSIYQYWASRIRRPMVNGYAPAVPEAYRKNVVWPLFDLNYGELRREEIGLLESLRAGHVVLHQDVFPPKVSPFGYQETLRRLRAQPALQEIARDGAVFLFRLREDVPPAPPVAVESPLAVYVPVYRLPRHLGRVRPDDDTVSGHLVRAVPGDSGFLAFGPNRSFPSGRFETLFRLRGNPGEGGTVRIQVTAESGERILAERRIDRELAAEEFRTFRLAWELPRYAWIETRIRVELPDRPGVFVDADMTVSQVRRSPAGNPTIYGPYDLLQEVGTLVTDPRASEGWALHAAERTSGLLARGPWRLVRAGTYRACVRTASPGDSGEAGHLRILDGRGELRSQTPLPLTGDVYRDTCTTLVLDKDEVLEFQVQVLGDRATRFDRLAVTGTGREAKESGDADSLMPPG